MDTVRVNIATKVNAADIKRETIDGRDVLVVPSATMPDDVVMNNVHYSGDEIEKSYRTLERTPAPFGHPSNESGDFVSARDPLGLNGNYFGAYNANVVRRNGRVFVDKIIDIERANESEMGRRVIDAVNKGQPIHTSTGLYMRPEKVAANSDIEAEYTATDIIFDHDAILLDEPGAATPEQGVGMMVNKALTFEGKPVELLESIVYDDNHEGKGGMHKTLNSILKIFEGSLMKNNADDKGLGDPKMEKDVTDAMGDNMDDKERQYGALYEMMEKTMAEMMAEDNMRDKMRGMMEDMLPKMMESMMPKMMKTHAANVEKSDLVERAVKNGLDETLAKETPVEILKTLVDSPMPASAGIMRNSRVANKSKTFELPEA